MKCIHDYDDGVVVVVGIQLQLKDRQVAQNTLMAHSLIPSPSFPPSLLLSLSLSLSKFMKLFSFHFIHTTLQNISNYKKVCRQFHITDTAAYI